LADLGNSKVLTMHSIFALLESLFELTSGENVSENLLEKAFYAIFKIKSDYIVWCVLHTLPMIGPELNDVMPGQLNELLARMHRYLSDRKKPHIKVNCQCQYLI
jgi:hypothetical protein